MTIKKNILAICGSTRKKSTNSYLIKAIIALSQDIFAFEIFDDLAGIPHFNPDIDNEFTPVQILNFREQLKKADGILICTPEYAMGVPGSLKNAIDWTVSSCEFSNKPTALITASLSGLKGHASLLETLNIIEARTTPEIQLIISNAKIKISNQGIITDEPSLSVVKSLLQSFIELMNQS